MAKKVKFPLKMADDARVSSLEELREHFDLESVLGYYTSGRLAEWLEDRYYDEEAEAVQALDAASPTFKAELCKALGVEYTADGTDELDLADIAARNERRERLKAITADEKILAAADRVAFTQEDLADLLDNGVQEIYLCTGPFKIPGRMENVTYIGVDHPKAEPPKDFASKGIVFQNVDVGIDDIIRQAKEAPDEEDATLWLMAAELGDAHAQYMVGTRYYFGDSNVEQSYEEAVIWYRKAADQGWADAQNDLGNCYYNGEGVEQSYEEAVKWCRKAVEQGNANAQYNLGLCYYYGEGVKQDYAEAAKWYRKAAEQGLAEAQNNLGDCYYNGEGVEQDYEEAVNWFRKAAEQGFAEAQNSLGDCYYNGEGVGQDYQEAVNWYRKAAEQGFDWAQYNLGNCYYNGEGVEEDWYWATSWYREAAEQGNADAQYALGKYYDGLKYKDIAGMDEEENEEEATKWYRAAAEQGHADAQYEMGLMSGGSERVAWLLKASNQGHVEATRQIGEYYFGTVDECKRDRQEAAKWYQKAAEMGSAHACYLLGNCYFHGGYGLTPNPDKALEWWIRGAENGWGALSLARRYCKGDGVPKDIQKAIYWYRKQIECGQIPSLKGSAMADLRRLGVNP